MKYYFGVVRTTSRSWPDGLYEDFVSKRHPFEIVKEIKEIDDEEIRAPILLAWQEIFKSDFDLALQCGIEEWI